MSNILSTVLITAPVGFLAGWLLCKAVFQHLSVIRPNPAVAARHRSVPAEANSSALASANPSANEAPAGLKPTRNEIQLLKEAIAERDHQISNLQKQVAAKPVPLEYSPDNVAAQDTKLRATIKALREGLGSKDHQLETLQAAMHAARNKSVATRRILRSWRTRIHILVKQLRQQKLIISELREELKQREQRQRELENRPQLNSLTTVKPAPESLASNSAELRSLRGVGPAMQIKLNEQGIYRLNQLADINFADLMALGKALSINEARMAKINWPEQARQLLNRPAKPDSRLPAEHPELASV